MCLICCILTSDPAKHANSKTAEVAYSIGVGELGWQYGTGLKSHGTVTNWCTGRGWPVNCMTVISARWWSKRAILKTAEVAHSVGHLWEEIEWGLNYYITQCTGNSMSFEDQTNRRQDAVEKASTQQREPSGPRLKVWGSEELEKWCCRENSTKQRAGHPGLRLSSPGERKRNGYGQ